MHALEDVSKAHTNRILNKCCTHHSIFLKFCESPCNSGLHNKLQNCVKNLHSNKNAIAKFSSAWNSYLFYKQGILSRALLHSERKISCIVVFTKKQYTAKCQNLVKLIPFSKLHESLHDN